ncbi:hypothetical protein LJB98_01805 [Bacteroidales bacterium OttesenSCG-928-M11]|nr:hypothetical protein [Bacteroidales bacterium OttesenSCG-928-M11]
MGKLNVIIADDNKNKTKRIKSFLKSNSSILSEVYPDANSCIEALRRKHYDILILDLVIDNSYEEEDPKAEYGLKVLKSLQIESQINKPTHVILLTHFVDIYEKYEAEIKKYPCKIIIYNQNSNEWEYSISDCINCLLTLKTNHYSKLETEISNVSVSKLELEQELKLREDSLYSHLKEQGDSVEYSAKSTNDYIKLIDGYISVEKSNIVRELCDVLCENLWRPQLKDAMSNFTDHKLEHSYRVLKRALQITNNAKRYKNNFIYLNENELYILALSSLLHDIAMSGHPKMEFDRNIMQYFDQEKSASIHFEEYPIDAKDYSDQQQNEVRRYHAYFAIAKIKLALNEKKHYLHNILSKVEDKYWKYVFTIIKFHSKEKVSDIPPSIENNPETDLIRVPFTTILFRMADELDLGKERDIEAARRQGMPSESRAYWEMDYRMNVIIDENNYINIKFRANEIDIRNHSKLFSTLIKNHIHKNRELVNKLHQYGLILVYNEYDELTLIENKEESIQSTIIDELKKIANQDKTKEENDNDRIAFLENNFMSGFKLKKNYMGIIIPRIGNKYKLYVYKEFYLFKKKESIKCKIHINKKHNETSTALDENNLKLSAYISYHSENSNFDEFIKCDVIDKISAGEEYFHFRLHFKRKKQNKDIKLPIEKGDIIAVFYTYEVDCIHYGNELVRDSTIFADSELMCELSYPEKNESFYNIDFYERDDQGELTLLKGNNKCRTTSSSSIFKKLHKNNNFTKIIDELFFDTGCKYLQMDYKKWLNNNKKTHYNIYTFVANWNFVPFFTDPDMYLRMERYVNNGSPSGFTKINNTSKKYTPYSKTTEFGVPIIQIDDHSSCKDFGFIPSWLNQNEILVHPDYEGLFMDNKKSTLAVIPTASSRTVFVTDKKCYAKLQYNKKIGRIERVFTPEKIDNSIKISALLKEKFNQKVFSEDLFILPEEFGRIIDFGENFQKRFDSRYLGMIIRDYLPYPNHEIVDSQWRLIPAFSLFADTNEIMSKSIIELLYDFREDTSINYETFICNKIIKPVYKLYFEFLLKTGLHIEGHAQNILYLITINENKLNIRGVVIRDFESFDKDLDIIGSLNIKHKFGSLNERTNCSQDKDSYTKRNSFLFDFKLGEYLITPLLDHSEKKIESFRKKSVISEIKKFNEEYIKLLPEDFFPKGTWYSYKNIEIDRTRSTRPWQEHAKPKYRKR